MRSYDRSPIQGLVYLLTKVGSTYTNASLGTVIIAANADLEARVTGTTVKAYYNNTQVGTDQTVDNAALNNSTYVDMFSAGGNSLNRFFVQAN
jgi:hypothetical protein